MATSQQFSLRWNNYQSHITYAFDNLRSQDDFVDVTLCCDGRKIKAHKLLLSACSGYFKEIFKENPCPHPVIIFKFIKFEDLQAIIEFMYQGEVNVQQEALQSFLQTAELLSVQGLTSEEKEKSKSNKPPIDQRIIEEQLVKALPATVRTVTSESNAQTQTQTIELQANIIQNSVRKRKLTFTEDDDSVYTETVEFVKEEPTIVKTTEVQFLPTTMKMDMPEYIQVPESSQMTSESQQQTQQTSQDTTTQTTGQFTSGYEILTDQSAYESEMENKFSGNEEPEAGEITSVEMGRIFTSNSGESNAGEKSNSSVQEISALEIKIDKKRMSKNKNLKRKKVSRKVKRRNAAVIKRFKSDRPSTVTPGPSGTHLAQAIVVGPGSHSAEVGFRCSICWKGFKHPTSLTLHKDLHSGKTQCPVCQRHFSRSYDMKAHLTRIHKITLSLDAKFNVRKVD